MNQEITYIKTLKETSFYRIILIKFENEYCSKPKDMIELYGKINNEIFFIIRRDNWDCYLKELIELGAVISKTHKAGFIKHYGNYDHPLAEFKDALRKDFLKYVPLTRVKTTLNIYRFLGNHEDYSGAFCYYIWDRGIVTEVSKKCIKEQRRSK